MNDYQDQIDLRPYIVTILKYKWWIILVGIVFAVIALVYTIMQSRQYSSTATLLLTRSRPVLELADQFPTVSEPVDSRSRMDALLNIAETDAVIQQTIQDLGEILPTNYRSIEGLRRRLSINSQGDSLSVTARAETPELAAQIANSWAAQIVQSINFAYSGEQPLEKIQEQLKNAKQEYDSAQQALEAYIQENQKLSLEQKYNEAKIVFERLGYANATEIDWLVQRKQSMDELRIRAEALKTQIENGSLSTAGNKGDALAVLLARMNALGIQSRPPSSNTVLPSSSSTGSTSSGQTINFPQAAEVVLNLQVEENNIQSDQNGDYARDLDTLIQLAEDEKIKAEEAINLLSSEILQESNDPGSIREKTTSRLQDLETQLEQARAMEKQLTSNRDLSWEAYQAMAQKETEIKNAALTSSQINISSLAIVPVEPVARGTVTKTVLAGILGASLTTIIILFLAWWKSSDQKPEPAAENKNNQSESA